MVGKQQRETENEAPPCYVNEKTDSFVIFVSGFHTFCVIHIVWLRSDRGRLLS